MTLNAENTEFAPAERLSKKEVLEQYHLIKKSKDITGDIFDKLPIMILILNRYRQMIFANEYFKKITKIEDITTVLGMRPGEIFNCKFSDLLPGGCGTTKFCRNCGTVNTILASLKGVGDIRECNLQCKNEDSLCLLVSSEPFNFENEPYVVFTIQDIEDTKKRIMLENVFFGLVRKNLAEMKIISDMLTENYRDDEFIKRIDDLINDTLKEVDIQHFILEAMNFKIDVEPVYLNSKDLFNEIMKKYNIEKQIVKIDNKSQSIDFITDYYLISVALDKVVEYMVKALKEEGNIILSASEENDNLIIKIYSSKVIQEETQMEILKQSKYNETSLESLNFNFIKLLTKNYLKGTLYFTSDNEKGTIFYIRLPFDLSKFLFVKGENDGSND